MGLTEALSSLHPRQQVSVAAATVTLICGALIGSVSMPYALMRPGPVRDVLGTTTGQEDAPEMITISGRTTYPTEGTLDLLTVGILGGPGSRIRLLPALQGWLDPTISVRPLAEVFPPDLSRQEIEQQNSAQMDTSQENATAAALGELGIDIPATLTVESFVEGSKAEGVMRTGDVVVTAQGQRVDHLASLRDVLDDVGAGNEATLGVRRDGRIVQVKVTTIEGSPPENRPALGVLVNPDYDFPFEVDIRIDSVGGPSAGMMFALGIVEKLTPGAMTGGERIAGTGTMDANGAVGPIGGVRQKLLGAQRSGATWFLAPAGNCPEVVGYEPAGLTVLRVATLHEARTAVETIGSGGDISSLPRCG